MLALKKIKQTSGWHYAVVFITLFIASISYSSANRSVGILGKLDWPQTPKEKCSG